MSILWLMICITIQLLIKFFESNFGHCPLGTTIVSILIVTKIVIYSNILFIVTILSKLWVILIFILHWLLSLKSIFLVYISVWLKKNTTFINLFMVLLFLVFILLSIAFFTLLERKTMSSIQRRRGPNKVGFFGILQPFADGLKLILKELIHTSNANIVIFFLAPIFTFICTLTSWLLIPFNRDNYLIELPFSLLVLLAISSLSVHGIIFAGWSSNSKYAFLGGIRSASQMISYEISISTIYLSVILISDSFSLTKIVESQKIIWNIFPLFPLWILFIVSALAETNRAPFDLPEAEAELVAGYNVEYSAIAFALFFLAEYGNIIIMSAVSSILFFGGWHNIIETIFLPNNIKIDEKQTIINAVLLDRVGYSLLSVWIDSLIFVLKIIFNMFIFLWVRSAFPRYRYDQLMKIGWTFLIPLSFMLLMLEASIIFSFQI